jgi:high affinity Mn2+ porin
LALVGFITRGRMGSFDDAVALATITGEPADIAAVRRFNTRPGVNLNVEQQLADDFGMFGRTGWADGSLEPYEFADIDRTVSAGVSLWGARWGRRADTLAVAAVINDISSSHRAYLNAGGLGILVGDGQLPHRHRAHHRNVLSNTDGLLANHGRLSVGRQSGVQPRSWPGVRPGHPRAHAVLIQA